MSSPVSGDDEQLALDHFFRCLSNSIRSWVYHVLISFLSQDIQVASAVLIFYDWALTSGDEFAFVWRRSKNNYTRILFICARYPALASVILNLLPLLQGRGTHKAGNAQTWLQVVTIICSEVPAIVGLVYALHITPTVVTPSVALVTEDGTVVRCNVLTGTTKRFLVIPYVSIMAIEAGQESYWTYFGLTVWCLFRLTPAGLADARDLTGLMYFVFMLLVGIMNVGLVFHAFVSMASIIAILVALLTPYSKLEESAFVHWTSRTVFHSILSTRIVLHTTTVLRQGIADSRAAVAQDRLSTRMEFARDTTIEIVAN
ncbi:hypothetical protein BC826DRAFT_967534 [Russula brevipes]|nr:hypothetical protein BC826DRAFT_967534 [Russula brevipes]